MDRDFGARIRSVRQSLGLSQKNFGQMLNISLPTVNRFENGHRIPDADLMCRVAEVFNRDIAWLMTGERSQACPVLSEMPADPFSPPMDLIVGEVSYPGRATVSAAIRQRDNSMAPLINPGDLVVFVPGPCSNGDVAVLTSRDGVPILRKLKIIGDVVYYVASNSEYDDSGECSSLTYVGRVTTIVRSIAQGNEC